MTVTIFDPQKEIKRIRDEIAMVETLDDRGRLEKHVQPEVFPIDPKRGLAGLQKVLHLPERPRTIEGVDIAHTAGTDTVASVVQFIDGLPFKPGYKRLRIQSVEGPNDVASIHEAVLRRFQHLQRENETPPDILLIDGGLGQLHAAQAALQSLGMNAQRLISLAKREELVYTQDGEEPLHLSRHSFALRLLQYVRDEAHRFGITHHRKRREKGTIKTELTEITGVGESTSTLLLRKFRSVKGIKEASLADLQKVAGLAKGKIVFAYFHPETDINRN